MGHHHHGPQWAHSNTRKRKNSKMETRLVFASDQTEERASLVAQTVKNLPAMRETWVQFLGWEDPLEKGMATHSSILA